MSKCVYCQREIHTDTHNKRTVGQSRLRKLIPIAFTKYPNTLDKDGYCNDCRKYKEKPNGKDIRRHA